MRVEEVSVYSASREQGGIARPVELLMPGRGRGCSLRGKSWRLTPGGKEGCGPGGTLRQIPGGGRRQEESFGCPSMKGEAT